MSTMRGELTELVKRHYTNVSEGQVESDRDIMSADIVHVNAAAWTVTGIEALLAFVTSFKRAFPDLRWEMRQFIEGSDTVVAEGMFLGTNTGPMVGLWGSLPAPAGALSFHSVTFGRYAMGGSSRIASIMTNSHSWVS